MVALAGSLALDCTDPLFDSAAAALRPPPLLTVSEWADEHRVLTSRESPEPGQWRTSRVPYAREIMDCLSADSPVERIVFLKSAQVGATEVGNNWIGYVVHHAPGPMLAVQPTVDIAKRFSKQRIAPLIDASAALRERIMPTRSRDSGNTLLSKEFSGGILLMAGANSAAGLRSMPICYLFLDEVDAYPHDADGEGDPVALAEQRTQNFSRRKIFLPSTPTIEGTSRIAEAFEESDQRRFWVPCPECDQYQTLKWAHVHWPDGHPEAAVYVCEHCACPWDDPARWGAIQRGEWRAERPFKGTAGFHIWAAYSPWVRLGSLAVEFVRAKGNPERLKTFVNTKLGETWKADAETVDPTGLMGRREAYDANPLPDGVVLLTAGVDTQDDRLEVEVVGWGRDEESWSIDYLVIRGDPSVRATWDDLDRALTEIYDHPAGVRLRIAAVCIDSQGHHTQAVYRFAKARYARRVWAVAGRGGAGKPIMGKPTKNNKGRVQLFPVGVDVVKDLIAARLRIEAPGPGYCHFPERYTEDYFQQLTAEKVTTVYHKGFPKRVWFKKSGARNEALDCRVYATAALEGLSVNLNRLADEMEQRGAGKPVASARRRRRVRSQGVAA